MAEAAADQNPPPPPASPAPPPSVPLADPVSLELQRVDLELKKQQLAEALKKPPPKRWWTVLFEGLALPAAVIAIVIQLTTASGNIATNAKTEVETEKGKAEITKTQLETDKLRLELVKLRNDAASVPREDLQKLIPRLQDSVDQLRSLQAVPPSSVWTRAIAKYILVWVLLHLVGLIFDVVQNVWHSLVSSLFLAIATREPKVRTEAAYAKHRRFQRWAQWVQTMLHPVPSVFRWSISLSIFAALIIPLFNEVAQSFDPKNSFDPIWANVSHLRIGLALADMKAMLFGHATP